MESTVEFPRNVVVVGMARSGTSLGARIFANQGFFVADRPAQQLQAGSRNNPDGYWELDALVDANNEILGSVGFIHHNTWMYGEFSDNQAAAVYGLPKSEPHRQLLMHFEQNRPWVWKDPRLCYTLPYWWPMMDPKTTIVLLVTRDSRDIWKSFVRTGWVPRSELRRGQFLRRIASHQSAAREAIKRLSIPHVEVDYSEYYVNPAGLALRLNRRIGLKLSVPDLGFRRRGTMDTFRRGIGRVLRAIARFLPHTLRRRL